MIWLVATTTIMAASMIACGITAVKLRYRWDAIDVSCARFLFFLFFVYLWIWCAARTVYYVWLCTLKQASDRDGVNGHHMTPTQKLPSHPIFRLGIHSILYLEAAKSGWITALVVTGDAGLWGVALVSFPLAYEHFCIAARAMDRGVERERAMIRAYCWALHALVLAFIIIEATLAIVFKGYNTYTHACMLGIYVSQALSVAYMLLLLGALKLTGRQNESVHGEFVRSPIYMRLKRLLLVYVVFMLQFQVFSIVYFATRQQSTFMTRYISATVFTFNATGLALSITTCCSQMCILNISRCCLPSNAEAQLRRRELVGADAPSVQPPPPPPQEAPVFVVTDIESSSALWAIDDGRIMQQATEIHDRILRAQLVECRGYEITTAGDSFHLAFHTIREAAEFCLTVQLELLVAKWPKRLYNAIAATRTQRAGVLRTTIFRGLRVRMGIHDAAPEDGPLVCDPHTVTGNMTYTGASKAIVDEIGDVGHGGQILTTQRVADWLEQHSDLVGVRFVIAHVRAYAIPQVNAHLELFQVTPALLKARMRCFRALRSFQSGSSSGPQHPGARTATPVDIACLLEWRIGAANDRANNHASEQVLEDGLSAADAYVALASPHRVHDP